MHTREIHIIDNKKSDSNKNMYLSQELVAQFHVIDDKNSGRNKLCIYNKSWLLSTNTIFTFISKSNSQVKG